MTEKVFGSEKTGSIRDIPLPGNGDSQERNTLDLQSEAPGATKQGGDNFDDWGTSIKRKNRRLGSKLIGLLVIAAVGLFVYSTVFHHATVELAAKTVKVTASGKNFEASTTGADGSMAFARLNPAFSKTISSSVEGSQEENRQTKATGIITVFNTDNEEKAYIKNTRFATEDGRVYRAFKRFVLPAGTASAPGSTQVLVYADVPGEKYNSEKGLAFKLPALQELGSDDYDLVYATQKDPLTGGFSGVVKVPTSAEIAAAREALKTELSENLFADFTAQMPENYIIIKDYVVVSEPIYTEKPNADGSGLVVEARSELQSVVFTREALESYLAIQLLELSDREKDLAIKNLGELKITITNKDFDVEKNNQFEFTVQGDPMFEYQVNEMQIAETLAGKLKSHITSGLVAGFDQADSVEVTIRPFWRRSVPSSTDKIDIEIVKE